MILVFEGPVDSSPLQLGQSGTSGRMVCHFIADGPQLLFISRIPSCIIHIQLYIAQKNVK
jgi:hypothetical protein